ncbi:hypothetical protein Tco_0133525 [Tanacetum coccineum]
MTANRIDVIDMASEEYSQEVLGFSDSVAYGNPSPCFDPIMLISISDLNSIWRKSGSLSHSLKGNILNNEPPTPIPNQGDCSPETQEEIKLCEAKTVKSSIDEPPEVELKDLPPHLEYEFFNDDNKLRHHAKELVWERKADLIMIDFPISDSPWGRPDTLCAHKRMLSEIATMGSLLQEFDFKVLDTKGAENLLQQPITIPY